MLYLIVSDIHGAKSSAEKILLLDNKYNFSSILVLGDINYNGARNVPPADYSPIDVTKILKNIKEKCIFIRGNCDSRVDEFVLEKKFHDIKKIEIKNRKFILTHGDLYTKDNYKIKKSQVFLYGHTHIYELTKLNKNRFVINPGSISLPKNNNPRTYLIFDDENELFSLYNIDDVLIGSLSIK